MNESTKNQLDHFLSNFSQPAPQHYNPTQSLYAWVIRIDGSNVNLRLENSYLWNTPQKAGAVLRRTRNRLIGYRWQQPPAFLDQVIPTPKEDEDEAIRYIKSKINVVKILRTEFVNPHSD